MSRWNRPHTEIAEWYWLTEYLDYSARLDNIVYPSPHLSSEVQK